MIIQLKNDTESDVTLDDGTVLAPGKTFEVPVERTDELLALIFAAPIGGKKKGDGDEDVTEKKVDEEETTETKEEKKETKKDQEEEAKDESLESLEADADKSKEPEATDDTKDIEDDEDLDEDEKRRRLEEEEKKKKAACKENDAIAEERQALAAERQALMAEKAQMSFDKFCAEGKLVPAQKEAYMALAGQATEVACAEGELKPIATLLNEFVESAPKHSLCKEEGTGGDGDPKPELTPVEKEVADMMGVSEKDLLKNKKED